MGDIRVGDVLLKRPKCPEINPKQWAKDWWDDYADQVIDKAIENEAYPPPRKVAEMVFKWLKEGEPLYDYAGAFNEWLKKNDEWHRWRERRKS